MAQIDKSKTYKIVDAYEKHFGEKREVSIGKVGKFHTLIMGIPFQFVYDFENMKGIRSSNVLAFEFKDGKLHIYTLNTVYVFEEVQNEG